MRLTWPCGKKSLPSRRTATSVEDIKKIHALIESGELIRRVERVTGDLN